MRISKRDVGRWCTVKYDDVGRIDALIVDVNPDDKNVDIFAPAFEGEGTNNVDFSQVKELRDYVEVK